MRARRWMRALSTMTAAFLLSMLAAPASADEPLEVSLTFQNDNVIPCTGEPVTTTVDVLLRVHEHEKGSVVTWQQIGTNTGGYVLRNVGGIHQIAGDFAGGTGIRNVHNHQVWRNPATGVAFNVKSIFVLDARNDTVRVARFSVSCLGPQPGFRSTPGGLRE